MLALECTISADLFRIAYACVSKEETRYYLNGVHIEPHPDGGVLLVSTDGHRMLCIHDPDGQSDGNGIIRASKEFLGLCKSGKESPRRLVVSGSSATLREDTAPVAFQKDCLIDGTFPAWRRVVPPTPDQWAPASFNAPYVAEFAKIATALAKATDSSSRAVRFVSKSPADPTIVLFPGMPAFGVLMPIRTDDAVSPPEFFGPAAVQEHAEPAQAA